MRPGLALLLFVFVVLLLWPLRWVVIGMAIVVGIVAGIIYLKNNKS